MGCGGSKEPPPSSSTPLPLNNIPKKQAQAADPTKEEPSLSQRRGVPSLAVPAAQGTLLAAIEESAQDPAQLLRETLEATKASLGPMHPSTLTAMNNLASLQEDNGLLDDAEKLFRECLQARRQSLGDRDPATVTSINNLGMLLHDAGWTMAVGAADEQMLGEAASLLREALALRRAVEGDGHPDTLDSIYNLGRLLQDRGELEEAAALLREELDGAAALKGAAHEETISSAANLRKVLEAGGKKAEAAALAAEFGLDKSAEERAAMLPSRALPLPASAEALAARRKQFGDAHPSTLEAMGELAAKQQREGQKKEAEALLREAVGLWKGLVGERDPAYLRALHELAMVLQARRLNDEATMLLLQAVAGRKEVLGAAHPQTLETAGQLRGLLLAAGKRNDARAIAAEYDLPPTAEEEADKIKKEAERNGGISIDAHGHLVEGAPTTKRSEGKAAQPRT